MRRFSQLSWMEDSFRRERSHRTWQAVTGVIGGVVLYRQAFHDAYDLRMTRLTDATRREHAHRVFAAIQAVAAVVSTAAIYGSIHSKEWGDRLDGVAMLNAAGWLP